MLPRCSFKEVAQSACCSARGPKCEVFEYSLILKKILTGADENSIKTHMNGGEQRTALTGKTMRGSSYFMRALQKIQE